MDNKFKQEKCKKWDGRCEIWIIGGAIGDDKEWTCWIVIIKKWGNRYIIKVEI